MASLNEISYSIWERIRPFITDDDDIDSRHIKFMVDNWRNTLLKQSLHKNSIGVLEDTQQDLGCVELELADPAECCDGTEAPCKVLRTEKKIPKPLNVRNKLLITRVGPIDKTDRSYSFVPYHQSIYSGNGKFNKNFIFAFYLNERIYLKIGPQNFRGKYLEKINIRGVFSDPRAVGEFADCDGGKCYDDDQEYPLNDDLISQLEERVFKQLLQTVQLPGDDKGDADDSTTPDSSSPAKQNQ